MASSRGRYRMHRYCCVNHTAPDRYPSAWYAFDAGLARFYVLQAAWPNSNLGTADMYRNDHDAHWRTSSAEMQWLRHDLRTHRRRVLFAFFHFPLNADGATEGSDPWLHGPRHLEGVLGKHGVDVVFNGHAHIYERNARSAPGMPISYVTGGGGGNLHELASAVHSTVTLSGGPTARTRTEALAAKPLCQARSRTSSTSFWFAFMVGR